MRTANRVLSGLAAAAVIAGAVAGCAGASEPATRSTTSGSGIAAGCTSATPSAPSLPAPTTGTAAPAMDDDVRVPAPTGPAPVPADAVDRAVGFVTAWARPSLDAAAWFAGVKGYLAPAAAALYASTDPAHVPATAVTGAGVLAVDSTSTATVRVPTNAGEVTVHLHYDASGAKWLVDRMEAAS